MRKYISCFTFLLVVSCLPFVHAQNKDIMEMSLEELLSIDIITASKVLQKANEAPVTVRTITRETIQKMGFRDLKDIFRTLPGFDVSYDVQGEVRSLVIARGILGNQKLKVLLDGKRYSPDTGERFVYGNNIPLSMISRIEIVYGSASALYGADAFSGVINLITLKGDEVNGQVTNIGYLDTDAAVADITYGKAFENGLDLIFSFRTFQGNDFDLHETYEDYAVVNQYSGELGALSNQYPIDNWNALIKASKGPWRFGFDWQHMVETNAPSTIPTNYAYVEDYVWAQNLGHAYLERDWKINDKLDLQATISAGRYEVDPRSNFFVVQDLELTSAVPSYKYALSDSLSFDLQGTYSHDKYTLVAGLQFQDIKSFPKTQNLEHPFDPNGPLEDDLSAFVDANGYTFGLLGLEEAIFGERNYDNLGGFVQAQIPMGEKFDTTIGVRVDDNSIYGATTNPRLGLVYKASKNLSMRASYGTAYIQPSNYYRWENWANPFAMHIPNLDIQPETVTAYMVGGSYMAGNLSVQFDAYYNDLQDVIRPVPAPAQEGDYPFHNPLRGIIGEDPSTGFVEINANQGEIQTYGGEIELGIKRGTFVGSLSYSYVDGDDQGNPIAKTSKNKIIANATWSKGPIELGGTLRYYSDVNTTLFNSAYGIGGDGSLSFSGDTIGYVNMGWEATNKLRLNLTVDNIFDTKHYGAAPYGENVWITPNAPQAGRKALLNLKIAL